MPIGDDILIVGNVSDNPTALDVSHFFGQRTDVSDIISLKTFENTEFCPRFISTIPENKASLNDIGYSLKGKTIVIVSVPSQYVSRNDAAMRNMLVARAAKDNGAEWVLLLETDLNYSAQDRGPRAEHGKTKFKRDLGDMYKFNGQPFSALLYAQLLKEAGVDEIMSVHTHSDSNKAVYQEIFNGNYTDLLPDNLYAKYISESNIVDSDNLVLCAPDKGALDFVEKTKSALNNDNINIVLMDKVRTGERKVSTQISPSSPYPLQFVKGKDVIVIDDMVRTGSTILQCCSLLRDQGPNKIIFLVTHFHSSAEGREKLSAPVIDEIVTTNTIPSILNRDRQGRLRKKIAVLKLAPWFALHLKNRFKVDDTRSESDIDKWYQEDISSKNPRSPYFKEYL